MKVGFIGLGIMGKPMAQNLIKAGHTLTVFDLTPDKANEAIAAGATLAKSARDAAAGTEIIFTMVPDGPEVEAGSQEAIAPWRKARIVAATVAP